MLAALTKKPWLLTRYHRAMESRVTLLSSVVIVARFTLRILHLGSDSSLVQHWPLTRSRCICLPDLSHPASRLKVQRWTGHHPTLVFTLNWEDRSLEDLPPNMKAQEWGGFPPVGTGLVLSSDDSLSEHVKRSSMNQCCLGSYLSQDLATMEISCPLPQFFLHFNLNLKPKMRKRSLDTPPAPLLCSPLSPGHHYSSL